MGNVTILALLIIAQAVFAGAIYLVFDVAGKGRTVRIAEERVALVAETLKSTIDRFEAIPDLVSEARVVSEVLSTPDDSARRAQANAFLGQSGSHARLQALFVLNARGTTIASSNWQEPISFAIIRDHGGTISYERSQLGETRFHVRLPLCSPQQQEDHQETSP